MHNWTLSSTLILAFLACLPTGIAVKHQDFKTCSQAGFCRRGRALSARAKESSSWTSPYSINPASIVVASDEAAIAAAVKSSLYPDIKFDLELRIHKDGAARVRMDEVDGLRKRYDEAASWALISEPEISHDIQWIVGKKDVRAVYGEKKDIQVIVAFEPLRISLLRGGVEQVVLNGQGLLHMEHFRNKASPETKPAESTQEEGSDGDDAQTVLKVNPRAWFEGENEDDWWEEKFSSWTDSKPKGKGPLYRGNVHIVDSRG